MAVPKRKTSPSKRGMRRSADGLKAPTYVEDKNSGELRRPHHIDLKTGMYRGRQVLTRRKAHNPRCHRHDRPICIDPRSRKRPRGFSLWMLPASPAAPA